MIRRDVEAKNVEFKIKRYKKTKLKFEMLNAILWGSGLEKVLAVPLAHRTRQPIWGSPEVYFTASVAR